jgi:hypothetical protein
MPVLDSLKVADDALSGVPTNCENDTSYYIFENISRANMFKVDCPPLIECHMCNLTGQAYT